MKTNGIGNHANGNGAKAEAARLKKFIAHYIVHFSGAAAVRFAGYETQFPSEYARQLLSKLEVQAAVEEAIAELGELHFRLADEVIAHLVAMKNADRTSIYDADGNILDPRQWPEECKLLLRGVETEEHMTGQGDAAIMVRTKKVTLEAPKGIDDSLLKVTGRWIDRTQFMGKDGKPVDPGVITPVVNITVGTNPPPGGKK